MKSPRRLTDVEFLQINTMVSNYRKALRHLGYIPEHLIDAYSQRYQIGITEHTRGKHK